MKIKVSKCQFVKLIMKFKNKVDVQRWNLSNGKCNSIGKLDVVFMDLWSNKKWSCHCLGQTMKLMICLENELNDYN